MRWVTYSTGSSKPRTGIIEGDKVHGLPSGTQLLDLLGDDGHRLSEAGTQALRAPAEVLPLEDVRLLAPIPRPPSIRDGLCFLDHLRGCARAMGQTSELDPVWFQTPAFYFANTAGVVGPYDDVPVSPGSQMFDLELEVGAVVGRGGRDLHPDTAEDHIIGYLLYNDWTARDHQLIDMKQGIGMGKSKDSAITLGPALVTVDELEPYRRDGRLACELSATVNGTEITHGTLDQMDWTFGELVSYVSRGVDLTPGDVIGSGTVPGGCLLEHAADTGIVEDFTGWLQPGDTVVLRSDVLGETRQVVRPSAPVHPLAVRK
jgi:2-keto-4-pentenoate hydratase/2-oxohepta-3-ene-1,7-dioic acid hydratase in catechol pathway